MTDAPPLDFPRRTVTGPGTGRAERAAEFWEPAGEGRVACSLCYRCCTIADGDAGWCRSRVNRGGELQIPEHGVLSTVRVGLNGYETGFRPFFTFEPGLPSLYLGATYCTSSCSFCSSTDRVWRPETVPWLHDQPQAIAPPGSWSQLRALLHPADAVVNAQRLGCASITLGINEPTLSWEYTYDVARLAQAAGLRVLLHSNGFTTTAAIARLAPFVDAVIVGIKGSLDSDFYRRFMRAAEAPAAVWQACATWQKAGTLVRVGDLIAPPQMQTDAVAEAAQERLYQAVARELGPLTELFLYPIVLPRPGRGVVPLLPGARKGAADAPGRPAYVARLGRARRIGLASGLPYTRVLDQDYAGIVCHACGELLLRNTSASEYADVFNHEQHVTNGRCDHCGTAVPIVTLPRTRIIAARQALPRQPSRRGSRDADGRDGEEPGP